MLNVFIVYKADNNTFLLVIRRDFGIRNYEAHKYRICYIGYIINLSIQSFLFRTSSNTLESDSNTPDSFINTTIKIIKQFRKKRPLSRLYNIIIYI